MFLFRVFRVCGAFFLESISIWVILCFFIFYLIFAAPVQYFLNRKPKRFNLKYLLIYIFFSFLVWLVFAVITDLMNTLDFLMGYEI
ncbi:UPF0715 family protein, partial [Bacillus vallismortis]|nr:UPF0715 family protein [Bacillus vallismortis]